MSSGSDNFKFWKLIPASWAHKLAPTFFSLYANIFPAKHKNWLPLIWQSLHFPNRLGVPGGLDKDGEVLYHWEKLGAGFVEIGTITPKAQAPNPGVIMDRDFESKTLWNRMGFPNDGCSALRANLECHGKPNVPLFINIGKNRNTTFELAIQDYVHCFTELQSFADAFVINVSSPNTTGLRDLQSIDFLGSLFLELKKINPTIPVLVKLSPDEEDLRYIELCQALPKIGCNGLILTNTTLQRAPPLSHPNFPQQREWPETGGISGLPVKELSLKALRVCVKTLQDAAVDRKDFLVISVGGVLTASDVQERLNLGADLVQSYSGLVFNGPNFFEQVGKAMSEP